MEMLDYGAVDGVFVLSLSGRGFRRGGEGGLGCGVDEGFEGFGLCGGERRIVRVFVCD